MSPHHAVTNVRGQYSCSLGTGVTPVLKGILLWLIAVTQIQFAYLAADRLAPIKLGGGS
jgi:hypothetical protein